MAECFQSLSLMNQSTWRSQDLEANRSSKKEAKT
jgi:hypothetical protein